jgi:hypothetical protein
MVSTRLVVRIWLLLATVTVLFLLSPPGHAQPVCAWLAEIGKHPETQWSDLRSACIKDVDAYKASDPRGSSWFLSAGNGFAGVPFPAERATTFLRGSIIYDQTDMGFAWDVTQTGRLSDAAPTLMLYDTRREVCFEFTDSRGVSKYVRFRLINHDRGEDRGLPNAAFRANGRPSMEPVADDTRAPDFLRKDFLYKVRYSDVRYILQAQFREVPDPPVVNHELFDPSQPWNEYWYPWADMFDIRLTETVEDYDAVAKLAMNPNRSPRCIKIPLATSPDHYASLGHARAIIYPGARAVRASVPPPQNN